MSSCMVKETGRSRQAMQSTRSVLRCVLVSAPRCATRDSRSVEAAALHYTGMHTFTHRHRHMQLQLNACSCARNCRRETADTGVS